MTGSALAAMEENGVQGRGTQWQLCDAMSRRVLQSMGNHWQLWRSWYCHADHRHSQVRQRGRDATFIALEITGSRAEARTHGLVSACRAMAVMSCWGEEGNARDCRHWLGSCVAAIGVTKEFASG